MRFVTKARRISGCTSPTQRTWSRRGGLCKLPVRRPHVTHDLTGRCGPRSRKAVFRRAERRGPAAIAPARRLCARTGLMQSATVQPAQRAQRSHTGHAWCQTAIAGRASQLRLLKPSPLLSTLVSPRWVTPRRRGMSPRRPPGVCSCVSRVHWKIQRSSIAVLELMHPALQVAGINGLGEVSLFGLLLCIKGGK